MVTHEDVKNIVMLSNLLVDDNDLERLTKDMTGIIEFANTINNAKIEGDAEFDNINNLSNVFRKDVVEESFPNEEILKNTKEVDEGHFLIKKRVL